MEERPCEDIKCSAQCIEVDIVEKKDFGIMRFGKYKDRKWSEAPKEYLEYLISAECNTPQRNKDIAKQCLGLMNVIDGQLEIKELKK